MNNLRTARLKILNNSVLPAVTSSMPKNSVESGEGTPARSAAHLVTRCLENKGVVYVFDLPGEENIQFIDALRGS
jgi:hypothetical protein